MEIIFLPLGISLAIIFLVYSSKRPDFIRRYFNELTSGEKVKPLNRVNTSANPKQKQPVEPVVIEQDAPLFKDTFEINMSIGFYFTLLLIALGIGFAVVFLKGCYNKKVAAEQAAKAYNDSLQNALNQPKPFSPSPTDKLIRLWKGQYADKHISLAILKITADSVWGYSSVDGNYAAFTGNISPENSADHLELREREAKLNGVFNLNYDSSENTIKGKWVSYDGELYGRVNLIPAMPGDTVKVIADKAFIFPEHDIKTQTEFFYTAGDILQFDSVSTFFIHCTYSNDGRQKASWLLVKKVVFQ